MARRVTETVALVSPFRPVRYGDAESLSTRIAPPYDVITPVQWERLAASDPYNVVRYILPQGPGDRHAGARALLAAWCEQHVLIQEKEPAVLVVQQAFSTPDGNRHVRTGVIAAVASEPFEHRRVRPHERTHAGPKEDRLALLRETQFIFESLLMVVPDSDGLLSEALRQVVDSAPLADAELDGVGIRLWSVGGEAAEDMTRAASATGLYIADGHHRYETAVAYREENARAERIPALLVPLSDPGLVVLPTHRLIIGKPLDGLSIEGRFRDWFQIKALPSGTDHAEELAALRRRGTACVVVVPPDAAFAMLLKGGAKLDEFVTGLHPTVASLDIMRVDELVVSRLAAEAGPGALVEYSPDADEVEEAVRSATAAAGVLVNPTPVERMLAVADAGQVMPPKSTYFYPKVPSGIVGMSYADRHPMTESGFK